MTWIIKRTNQFQKNYNKLPEYIQHKFKLNFGKFLEDNYDVSLKTHKLKGKFEGYLSSAINDDYRFLTLVNHERKEITVVNIGNHSIYS